MVELKFTDFRSNKIAQLFFTGEEIECGEFEAIKNLIILDDVQEFYGGKYYIARVRVTYENRAVIEKLSYYHVLNINRHKRGMKINEILELKRLSGF